MDSSLVSGSLKGLLGQSWRLSVAFVLASTLFSNMVFALAADPIVDNQQASPAKAEQPTAVNQPNIKGHIEASTITALTALKQAGRAIAKLKRASTSLYDEVTTRQVFTEEQGENVGEQAIPIPIGFTTGGEFLPPRKRWVDYDMQEIGQLLTLLQSDLDAVVIPAEKQPQASPIAGQISSVMQDVGVHYANLQTLTQLPDNNVQGIAEETAKIDSNMKEAEELRRKLFHIMKEAA